MQAHHDHHDQEHVEPEHMHKDGHDHLHAHAPTAHHSRSPTRLTQPIQL